MESTMNRNLLKYAVQRAIFNSDGTVADVRKSVLVEVTVAGGRHAMELMSGTKFDSLPDLAATVAALPEGSTVEVWDGRVRGNCYRKLTTPAPAQEEVLF